MKQAVFVYGTLMFPALFEQVAGVPLAAEPARLAGYRRHAVEAAARAPFPAIRAEAGACVDGLLIRNCAGDTLLRLDRFEGIEQGLYRRTAVEVTDRHRHRIAAQAYVAGPALAGRLGADWCPQHFAERHLDDYLAWLAGAPPR